MNTATHHEYQSDARPTLPTTTARRTRRFRPAQSARNRRVAAQSRQSRRFPDGRSMRGGQIVTRLLDVDVTRARFTFDWGGVAEQNRGVLAAPKLIFHAAPDGVRVEFTTPTPRETMFEGRPAFEVDFPAGAVLHAAARVFPRRGAGARSVYLQRTCCRTASVSASRCTICRWAALRCARRTSASRICEMGIALQDVELHFSVPGKLTLDLQLVSHRESTTAKGDRRYHARVQVRFDAGIGGEHAAAADHAARDEAAIARVT